MFDLEFRFATLFGLAGVILTWFLVWNIINYLGKILYTYLDVTVGINGNDYDNCKKIKVLWRSLLYPVGLLIILGWLCLVIWGGYNTNTISEQPRVLLELQEEAEEEAAEEAEEEAKEEGSKDLIIWKSDLFDKIPPARSWGDSQPLP